MSVETSEMIVDAVLTDNCVLVGELDVCWHNGGCGPNISCCGHNSSCRCDEAIACHNCLSGKLSDGRSVVMNRFRSSRGSHSYFLIPALLDSNGGPSDLLNHGRSRHLLVD